MVAQPKYFKNPMDEVRYACISQISANESCKTLLVQDNETGEYALKYLYTSWPVPNARLISCMNAYLQLNSPYIVRIRGFTVETSFSLITDMISGQTLRSLTINRKITQSSFTSSQIWRILLQLLEGVKAYQDFYNSVGAAADVPPNLFLAPSFIIVSDEHQLQVHITEFYQTLLLPSIQRLYMTSGAAPPEVSKHLPITAATNVWMIGAILYELLTLHQLDVERLDDLASNVTALAETTNPCPIDYKPLEPYQSVAVCTIMDQTKAFRYRELYALLSCMLIIVPSKRPPVDLLLDYARMHAPTPPSPSTVLASLEYSNAGLASVGTSGRQSTDVAIQSATTGRTNSADTLLHAMPLVGVKTDLHRAVEEQNLDRVLLNMHFARSTDADGDTALVYAIKANNEEAVKALAPEEIGVLTGEGYSPLYLALLLNRPGLTKYLEASYDMQFLHGMELWIDEHGISNLMRCVCERNLVGVYYYSEKQKKLQDYEERTALIKAVLNYNEGLPVGQEGVNLAIIKILYPLEARMTDKRGRTALMYAAECGYQDAITVLSQSEAGMRDGDGHNSLEIAFANGKLEAAQQLLIYEPVAHSCPDRQGMTDLMRACVKGDGFSFFCHLEQATATDVNGNTALMHCVINDRPEFIPKLNAEYRVINRVTGYSAMMLAVQLERPACFEALINHEVTLKSLDGLTALMISASKGLRFYVSRLMSLEANIFNGTWNALTYAIVGNHHEVVNLLAPVELNLPAVLRDYDAISDTVAEIEQELSEAASRNLLKASTLTDSRMSTSSNNGFTPLMYAAQQANINAVWGLRDKYLKRQDVHGFTALIYATQVKSKECCKLLTEERDIFCAQGLSAWFYAYKCEHHEILDDIRPTINYIDKQNRLTALHALILGNEGGQLITHGAVATRALTPRSFRTRGGSGHVQRDQTAAQSSPSHISANSSSTKLGSSQSSSSEYLKDVSSLLYFAKLYTKSGETALMMAARSYHGKLDQNLLRLEAGMRDSYGKLASCIAIEHANIEFIAEILPFEKDILITDGFTELMLAILEDDATAMMKYISRADQRGQIVMSTYTALTIAIYCGKNTFVPLLAPYEANIEIYDKKKPLDLAYTTRNVEAIMFLMPYTYIGGRLALSQCLCGLIKTAMTDTHLSNESVYELLAAFHHSNYRELKQLLQNHNIQSMTAFRELATSFQAFSLNIEYLILPDAVFDAHGNSQLHVAALASDSRLATAFVHLHSLRNKLGETALMLAARTGNDTIVDILLGHEAEIQDNHKMTATEHSIVSGMFHKVPNLFLHEKAFLINECEFTPLMLAVLEGDTKSVNSSLKYAKLRSVSGMTALHIAIYLRQQSYIPLLKMEKGILTYDGLSPWFLAKEKRLAYDLLEPEPTIDAMGCTELHRAAIQNNVQQIKNYIPLAKQYNASGRTALMEAGLAGSLDAAQILVSYEHSMRAKNRFVIDGSYFDEATALMFAAAAGHSDIVQLLLPYESRMHESCNGKTALMAAAAAGKLQTLELLIESEAGLTGQNGWTALMSVVSKQYIECVGPLLAKEAGMRDSQGNCALVIAIRNGNMDIVRLLAPIEAKIMGKPTLMRIWKSNTMYDEIIRYVNKLL